MAVGKKDYKDSEVRLKHKQKVPPQTLVKVEPSNDDTRTRAELLDAIEDLFQTVYTSTGASREVDLEDLRAILTMLVLSATNADDDGVGATQTQVDAINLNSTNIARNASDLATFISNISISNDKVGIGTTSPGARLHVNPPGTIGWSSLGNAGILIGTNTGAGIGIDQNEIASKGDHLFIGTIDANKDLILRTGGATNRLVVKGDTGNVGIGTSSPSNPLTVVGSDSVGIDDYILHNDDGNTKFGFPSNDTFKVRTAGSDRFYINSSGNVGIGTTSPARKLDVVGDVKIHNTGIGNNATLFIDTVSGSNDDSILNFRERSVDRASLYWDGGDNDLYLTTTIGDFLINPSGNVGIGTSSPTEKLEVNGNIKVGDSNEARFGAGNDLRIYHNGTNSNIENFTGTLQIVQTVDDGDITFRCDDGSGGTTPYLTIDGSATRTNVHKNMLFDDSVTLGIGSSYDLQLYHNGGTSLITNQNGNLLIRNQADDSDIIFQADDGSGGETEYFRVDGGGELTFFTKPIQMTDNAKIFFGVAGDLELYHDGTDSYVKNDTGDLYIQNTADDKDVIFQSDDGAGGIETYFFLDGSEGVVNFPDNKRLTFGTGRDLFLYHDGTNATFKNYVGDIVIQNEANDKDIRFKSDDGSGGIAEYFRVDGSSQVTIFSKGTSYGDNVKTQFGASGDLKIYHDGSNSFIDDSGTGKLRIRSNALQLEKYTGENMAVFNADGAASIYYDGSKKLETTSTGVEVTGNISLTGSVQKQIQVFPMNFTDDLGTDKHFMPFVTNTEQTVNYQEEAAMVMPADGRVVSVTVHYAQMHGAASDITVGIETSPCGQSYTNAWTIEETETISASADDDHHVFHFAFDNAKHFESTDKMALSIQQSVDLQNASRFFWVTAVIEYDWSTFLGGTSAEYGTTP